LILDEATANIDTVTRSAPGRDPEKTSGAHNKSYHTHRLITIANADEIFFVNAGKVIPAGTMEHAIDMPCFMKKEKLDVLM